jgi:hypothetical protein
MTAETLRRAAALMRERAEAAFVTPSPWGLANVAGQGFAIHHGEHDTVALYASRPDAVHIASWHPAVALAVADWLDHTARADEKGYTTPQEATDALAVARAYLGEAS